MSTLVEFIKAHLARLPRLPHIPSKVGRDEAYLNESANIYDLERRMRELDSPRRADTRGTGQGVFHC